MCAVSLILRIVKDDKKMHNAECWQLWFEQSPTGFIWSCGIKISQHWFAVSLGNATVQVLFQMTEYGSTRRQGDDSGSDLEPDVDTV